MSPLGTGKGGGKRGGGHDVPSLNLGLVVTAVPTGGGGGHPLGGGAGGDAADSDCSFGEDLEISIKVRGLVSSIEV
jgi:hypothetical protein